MERTTTNDRTTKYTTAVKQYMVIVGHATNVRILHVLQQTFPDVSATTVHRITSRLVERGELQLAPSGRDNIMRFDANLEPHDHFMCERCGMLKDAELSRTLKPFIEKAISADCSISGNLTVSGICKKCYKGGVA